MKLEFFQIHIDHLKEYFLIFQVILFLFFFISSPLISIGKKVPLLKKTSKAFLHKLVFPEESSPNKTIFISSSFISFNSFSELIKTFSSSEESEILYCSKYG